MSPSAALPSLLEAMLAGKLRSAVRYLSPRLRVKLTRHRRPSGRALGETFHLAVGAPNYAERAFIAECVEAGEPFPVRRIQVREYPAKKAAVSRKGGRRGR